MIGGDQDIGLIELPSEKLQAALPNAQFAAAADTPPTRTEPRLLLPEWYHRGHASVADVRSKTLVGRP